MAVPFSFTVTLLYRLKSRVEKYGTFSFEIHKRLLYPDVAYVLQNRATVSYLRRSGEVVGRDGVRRYFVVDEIRSDF